MKAIYLERPGQIVKRQIEKPKIKRGGGSGKNKFSGRLWL